MSLQSYCANSDDFPGQISNSIFSGMQGVKAKVHALGRDSSH